MFNETCFLFYILQTCMREDACAEEVASVHSFKICLLLEVSLRNVWKTQLWGI